MHGKDKRNYHLKVWIAAAKETNLPIFLLLDKVAEKEIKVLESEHLLDRENYHTLCKKQLEKTGTCDFEDYYPKDLLQEVVNKLAIEKETEVKTDSAKSKIEFKNDEPVVKKINEFLGRTNWKIEVATKVAEQLSNEKIEEDMDEIIRFLRRVAK